MSTPPFGDTQSSDRPARRTNAVWHRGAAGLALAALVVVAITPRTHAADATIDAVLACAGETNDSRRLQCFDSAVAGLRGKPPAAPVAAAVAAPAAPAAVAAAPTAAASAPAAPVAPPASSAEDRFGARGELLAEKQEELTAITATATAISTKPRGERVVTLDNGQVWAEIAPGSKIKLKAGDPVKIEAGMLGSFFLIAPNGRSSKVARVR